jgi:hypothetical protein
MLKIAIVLAEFGKPAPDVTQYRETWPGADIRVYGDADVARLPQFEGPRYGWRANDYWTVRKALDSDADVALCFDGDMRIVNREAARTLTSLAMVFGVCLPINPRYLQWVDFEAGADVSGTLDADERWAPSVNCSPIAISLKDLERRQLAEEYCWQMENYPVRGPVAWWRAMMHTGIAPLILPPQWCVCSRHVGIGGEIILHEGHDVVKRHYAGMMTK